MKSFYTNVLLALTTVGVSAAPSAHDVRRGLPIVQSNQLRRVLTRTALLAHAQKLQDISDVSGRNRVAGSVGHNKTVDYIYDTLVATGYYDVERQPFTYIFSDGNVTFSAAGTGYPSEYFQYGPAGSAVGPLVPVAATGCEAVSAHAISVSSCSFTNLKYSQTSPPR